MPGIAARRLTELLCNRKVCRINAHGSDVDLRRQSEVQDLRHDIGRLEIEDILRECRGQHLTQFLDVVGRRLVAFLERHLDDAIIDPDRRPIGECQIVGSRRQPDIVDNQRALLFGNDLTNLVLDRLEDRLRALDARSRRSANMKLDLPAVDQREKVAPDKRKHHRAKAEYQHGNDGNDRLPPKQRRQELRVSIAQPLEAAIECGGEPREQACSASPRPCGGVRS